MKESGKPVKAAESDVDVSIRLKTYKEIFFINNLPSALIPLTKFICIYTVDIKDELLKMLDLLLLL